MKTTKYTVAESRKAALLVFPYLDGTEGVQNSREEAEEYLKWSQKCCPNIKWHIYKLTRTDSVEEL